jgi:hypothetical protein
MIIKETWDLFPAGMPICCIMALTSKSPDDSEGQAAETGVKEFDNPVRDRTKQFLYHHRVRVSKLSPARAEQ